jgi:hypothetical protein
MENFVQKLSKYEKALLALFLLTLPLVNPWVRGDGVGYYAFARAPLIEHRLDFRQDWMNANESFRMWRVSGQGDSGSIDQDQYTSTGHLNNHFAVGPAILWAPFLIVTHAIVKTADALGGHIRADGFSRPYLVTMALATALYGFGALWISFHLARKYLPEHWAFAATLGIWFASSLPVYMYFNPSWSHAHSAFIVALFLWYWLRTRGERTLLQWVILGAIGGLMMDVYYINAVVLLLPFVESMAAYFSAIQRGEISRAGSMLFANALFSVTLLAAFLPTLITKKIIYGSFRNFGYGVPWYWSSPAFFKVALSSDHGFLAWTPILALAVVGLALFARTDRTLALGLGGVFLLYVYAIGCYADWDGLSSFGNRFFISLTPIFVIGLAAFFDWVAKAMRPQRAPWAVATATAIFVAGNFGMIFQWGTHLIPPRGPISWRVAAYNQVAVVPVMATGMLKSYFTSRSRLMNRIEQQDVRQLQYQKSGEMP